GRTVTGVQTCALPISVLMEHLDGAAGMKGWQWVFLVEGIPSVLLGLITLFYLTDRPADAAWLSPEERDWLVQRLEHERAHRDRRSEERRASRGGRASA